MICNHVFLGQSITEGLNLMNINICSEVSDSSHWSTVEILKTLNSENKNVNCSESITSLFHGRSACDS